MRLYALLLAGLLSIAPIFPAQGKTKTQKSRQGTVFPRSSVRKAKKFKPSKYKKPKHNKKPPRAKYGMKKHR